MRSPRTESAFAVATTKFPRRAGQAPRGAHESWLEDIHRQGLDLDAKARWGRALAFTHMR